MPAQSTISPSGHKVTLRFRMPDPPLSHTWKQRVHREHCNLFAVFRLITRITETKISTAAESVELMMAGIWGGNLANSPKCGHRAVIKRNTACSQMRPKRHQRYRTLDLWTLAEDRVGVRRATRQCSGMKRVPETLQSPFAAQQIPRWVSIGASTWWGGPSNFPGSMWTA